MSETTAAPTRSRTLPHRLSLVMAAVVIIGGLGTVGVLKLAGGPLAGEHEHDFGVVEVEGARALLEHTFHLTNRTRRTIHITNVTRSCGCTSAEPSRETIEPGGTVDIDATLKLAGSGLKQSNIKLVLDLEGREKVQTLFIQGIGKRVQPLRVTREQLDVQTGATARVSLSIEEYTGSEPPPPSLQTPDGVNATWGGWSRTRTFNKKTMRPGIWKGQVSVDLVGQLAPEAEMMVSVAGGKPIGVKLDLVEADEGE